jgi:hypothetical protein
MNLNEPPPSLSSMISAAEAKDWEYVDRHIEQISKDPIALDWATTGLESPDENLRDLAASIFEKENGDLPDGVAVKLFALVNAPKGRYDRFRAACALAAHGNHSRAVMARLHEFLEDPEVSSFAHKYLK